MPAAELPPEWQSIDRLIESGDLEGARAALQEAAAEAAPIAVLRLKLALRDRSLSPSAAMQKLVQIMREAPETPGAQALYREASSQSYQASISSPSHSHPRMPAVPGKDREEKE